MQAHFKKNSILSWYKLMLAIPGSFQKELNPQLVYKLMLAIPGSLQ